MAYDLCSLLQTVEQGQTSDNLAHISQDALIPFACSDLVVYFSSQQCVQGARTHEIRLMRTYVVDHQSTALLPTHTTGGEHHQPTIKETWRETEVRRTPRY